jgi:hypothetical protein
VVYDLLKACYDGGPAHKPATTVPYGAILLATDQVAADAVVVDILDELRAKAGLPSLWQREAAPTHIHTAADKAHALGCADRALIETIQLKV